MKELGIKFLLVQIQEAHADDKWPAGLKDHPMAQQNFQDRVNRAKQFIEESKPQDPFFVRVDGWDDTFDKKFHSWPDKYYFVDKDYKVLIKSEYGANVDALINYDSLDLITDLINRSDK